MANRDQLALDFMLALERPEVRASLSAAGYVQGVVTTVVSVGTVLDPDVIRRHGKQVVRQAPGTDIGWELFPLI